MSPKKPLNTIPRTKTLKEKERETERRKKTHNIQPPHQLPRQPQLRKSRPIGKLLQTLPHLVIGQDIEKPVLDPVLAQDADQLAAEAALRLTGGALHEEHDGRGFDQVGEAGVEFFFGGGGHGGGGGGGGEVG